MKLEDVILLHSYTNSYDENCLHELAVLNKNKDGYLILCDSKQCRASEYGYHIYPRFVSEKEKENVLEEDVARIMYERSMFFVSDSELESGIKYSKLQKINRKLIEHQDPTFFLRQRNKFCRHGDQFLDACK